uniref:Uncharacterized protein n=1 Tax=Pararge aegeria TaxID=116150 RepID=S4PW25_9NEOP
MILCVYDRRTHRFSNMKYCSSMRRTFIPTQNNAVISDAQFLYEILQLQSTHSSSNMKYCGINAHKGLL